MMTLRGNIHVFSRECNAVRFVIVELDSTLPNRRLDPEEDSAEFCEGSNGTSIFTITVFILPRIKKSVVWPWLKHLKTNLLRIQTIFVTCGGLMNPILWLVFENQEDVEPFLHHALVYDQLKALKIPVRASIAKRKPFQYRKIPKK